MLSAGAPAAPQTLEVGQGKDYAYHTIQAAVDAARPFDTVEIHSGKYLESVVVSKPHLTIEGAPGANVVITNSTAGSTAALPALPPHVAVAPGMIGIWVTADPTTAPAETTLPTGPLDGFRLSNVTITGFGCDGVVLTGVNNFVVSHVTAGNNGDYGLFPIFSSNGAVVNCVTSGSHDTGIYVGQSHDVVLLNNEAFQNVNGLEIENSVNCGAVGNNVHDNTVGILQDMQPDLPIERDTNNYIVGNMAVHNNFVDPSAEGEAAAEPSGVGIAVVGGNNTVVAGNQVHGNGYFGIAVLTLADVIGPVTYPPGVDPNPNGTLVIGNTVTGNGHAAPGGADLGWTGDGTNNQWLGNIFKTSNVPLPA